MRALSDYLPGQVVLSRAIAWDSKFLPCRCTGLIESVFESTRVLPELCQYRQHFTVNAPQAVCDYVRFPSHFPGFRSISLSESAYGGVHLQVTIVSNLADAIF